MRLIFHLVCLIIQVFMGGFYYRHDNPFMVACCASFAIFAVICANREVVKESQDGR